MAALIQFTATFIGSMISILTFDIGSEMSLSIDMLDWISLSFLLIVISTSVPLGKLVTHFGIKRYTKFNIILLIFGLILSAVSVDASMLLISRVIQGISVSTLLISIYLIIVKQIPDNKLGRALGIVGSCGYVGMSLAPALAGYLSVYSWRYAFLFAVPLCLAVLILLLKIDKEWVGEKHPINIKGSIIYFLSISLFIVGLNDIDEYGLIALVISIILFIILIKSEKNKENAMLNISLLKNFKLLIADYSAFVSYFITYIACYLLCIYLQAFLGLDSDFSGLILLVTPLVMVLVSPFSGRWADKYDSRLLSCLAMLILTAVMAMFYYVEIFPLEGIIVILIIQGIGHAMFSPPNNRYALTIVDSEEVNDATAILTTSKEFGKTCSIALFTVIFTILIGNNVTVFEEIGDFVDCYNILMVISIILSLSSAVLLLYSKYKYDEDTNFEILNFLKSIIS